MAATVLPMTIGFIGGGQMAFAMARGFLDSGLCSNENIYISDPSAYALDKCKKAGIMACNDNKKVVTGSDIVILAVKPQHAFVAIDNFREVWSQKKLLLSICAGITLTQLEERLGGSNSIIRVMPNTPCMIKKGASGYCGNSECTEEHYAVANKMLSATGVAHKVNEAQMDAITGLSGSGPAYVYMIIEAMSDAGVLKGLKRDISTSLAAQTVLGAAAMVLETNTAPAILKEQVTSPGGTTIAGVASLEKNGLRHAVISAVDIATTRAGELGGN